MTSSDRYAEQLWLTLFAKAPEITLFEFRALAAPAGARDRAAWQGAGTSFDFDTAAAPARLPDGSLRPDATIALLAGDTFEQADRVVGMLGEPVGVKAYRPYHSVGEDHLHSYLGMLGIPMDLVPEFPVEAPVVLLTESAQVRSRDRGEDQAPPARRQAGGDHLRAAGRPPGQGDRRYSRSCAPPAGESHCQEFLVGWFGTHMAEKQSPCRRSAT